MGTSEATDGGLLLCAFNFEDLRLHQFSKPVLEGALFCSQPGFIMLDHPASDWVMTVVENLLETDSRKYSS